jgi:uncharacterized protein (DUF1697 family)
MSLTYLALLRGINVGGKNKLPMKDLVELFVGAGCTDVRTYIQSGNVIFRADPGLAPRLSGLISGAIGARFGHQIPLVMRTAEQMGKVVTGNPYLKEGVVEDRLHVLFLAEPPDPRRVVALDPDRSPPDTFEVRGQEIYVRLPRGVAESKLTNQYFDSKLVTTSMGRNWRKVTTLFAMMTG